MDKLKKNPELDVTRVIIQLLATGPVIILSTTVRMGVGMVLTLGALLLVTAFAAPLIKVFVPAKIRSITFIILLATMIAVADLILKTFLPSLNEAIGILLPLLAVNCVILARPSEHVTVKTLSVSILRGILITIIFSALFMMVAVVRELLGNMTILDNSINFMEYPIGLFQTVAGGLIVVGFAAALIQFIFKTNKKGK